ncbi:MAG: Bax inhibitor-1 family protein [Lachnospiraceae bacterium]|nr:Bax inhibitor-1 family protein [Lachnospiraceae bacterium]
MEPNYENNNYNLQGTSQNGYPQNGYQQNGYQQNGYQQNGYQNNQFGYQQNFNGYNVNNGISGFSNAFSEAAEALRQKVVAQSFLFMVAALAVTAVGAKIGTEFMLQWMITNPVNLIILFVAEVAIVIVSNIALKKNNVVLSASLLTAYSFINGATLGVVCMGYVETSVTKVFIITAVMFAVTAFYGLVCKKDLSSVGSLCLMGLIGMILVGIVNIFLKSDGLGYAASFIGVAIFVGLTAYDTQKIKAKTAFADESNVTALSINGAFELYLDFINLFLYLLRIFGKRR